ncbi:hypothetical protein BD410DRAFT_779784 [Rickenella mellea]|uniref:Galactose oxidase n=1 Tax=Rickenella mellea TaxID=50990 RepID=A0A4R5XG93_9AGAM|nr:hypothetical protein BD410DRAFT_779784 [Rickenella mellea]
MALSLLLFGTILAHIFSTCALSPSTNTPVPPLQWLELTNLLQGSSPPALKDASIGYDETSRTLILFGGESNGFPQQQTYLLNLDSLQWSLPSPPTGLDQKPPPRSAAVSGGDFAASNRHGHIVIGGKGSDGKGLQDAWEFDYNSHFWSQINISPGGPSGRWGSAGGTDLLAAPVQDPIIPGPNNTFYTAGGFDGTTISPLSDIWQFNVAGVLTPNNPNNVVGSWQRMPSKGTLASKVREGGTVMPSTKIVAVGGCTNSAIHDNSCAQQDSYVMDITSTNSISPPGCPAARVGPALVPNYNTLSTSFKSQAFMILGTFNSTLWNDGNGLTKGEVDVLDTDTGVWTRLLPSGDPGSGSTPKFPTPREGASALSYPLALVGNARTTSADTIVFGGKDANGNYLQDVWILRAYLGSVSKTNESWSGFGDGNLQSGTNASGTGVRVQYVTTCAEAITPSTSPSPTLTSPHSQSPSPSQSGVPGQQAGSQSFLYDTSTMHKVLSPASIALLLPAILSFRFSAPSAFASESIDSRRVVFLWISACVALAAFGSGVAGLVTSFTSIVSLKTNPIVKRDANGTPVLPTAHSRAGLVLFAVLYCVIPLVLFGYWWTGRESSAHGHEDVDENDNERRHRINSNEIAFLSAAEKPASTERHAASPSQSSMGLSVMATPPMPAEPRQRTESSPVGGGGRLWPGYRRKRTRSRRSSDSGLEESASDSGATRGFEVLNRGSRMRRTSDLAPGGSMPRNLSDVSWLERRRSLNAVGELDYVMSQLQNSRRMGPATPGTEVSTAPLFPDPPVIPHPLLPSPFQCLVHVLLHTMLLGICVLSLVALWLRAPRVTFVVFLLWTAAFYFALLILAWSGRPRISILSVLLNGVRAGSNYHVPVAAATPPPSRPLSTQGLDQYVFPTGSERRSPYTYHQPTVRRARSSSHEDQFLSSNGQGRPHSENELEEDNEDEETQQRRIEQEMDRRNVSIVTVPKRKLWVTNPETT